MEIFVSQQCRVFSHQIQFANLKQKCCHVHFPVIMEESGSRLVFSHLSVLWEGKEKDEVP